MLETHIPRRNLILLILLFTIVWFGSLDYRKLIRPDEGRYAEISREMALTGDFTTPRLNGIKYFEKPPLQYWATAVAFNVFGEHDWTARLWPALTGFLSILLAAFTAGRLFGDRAGFFTGFVLASSLWQGIIGHINTLDMGLSFFLQLAVTGVLLTNSGPSNDNERRRWALITWAALALAVLSKGLVALVLSGGTLMVYSLLSRDWSPWRRMQWGQGLLLFFLICAPWFIAVSLANPEFPRFFFWHEHFERFLTKAHGRYQPGWYFVPILAIGALPWTFMALQSWLSAWRGSGRSDGHGRFRPKMLLAVWVVLVFAFFSVSHSKLASYILPILPALAILTGLWLTNVSRKTLMAHLTLVALLAAATLPLTLKVDGLADNEAPLEMIQAYSQWLSISTGIWLAGTLAALYAAYHNRVRSAVILLSIAAFLAGTGALQGHENLGRSNSSYHLAGEILPMLPAEAPFYSVQMYEQTLPYYLKRPVTLVGYRDEMDFGLDQQPELWVPTLAEFEQRWRAHDDAFAVMTPDTFKQLSEHRLPMREVGRDTRRVIVRTLEKTAK